MTEITPVLVIGFNRYECFKKVMLKVLRQRDVKLYVSIDGARNKDDLIEQEKINLFINHLNVEVVINRNEKNLGCALGVSSAIDFLFRHESCGIILEDDVLPSDEFFTFQKFYLKKYKDNKSVYSIGGFSAANMSRSYMSAHGSIWGWGTWADRWKNFSLKNRMSFPALIYSFKSECLLSTLINILSNRELRSGKLDTWDYQWKFTRLCQKSYNLLPPKSLVDNIGFDVFAGVHNRGERPKHVVKFSHNASGRNLDPELLLKSPLITGIRRRDYFRMRNIHQNYAYSVLKSLIRVVLFIK